MIMSGRRQVFLMRARPATLSRVNKVLNRILDAAAEQSIRFDDLIYVLQRLGFNEPRMRGSHRLLSRPGIPEIINLQPRQDATAKPYQVRQVRRLILKYGLHITIHREDASDE